MAGNYDRELEMELEQEFGGDFVGEFELAYDPDEADASAASSVRANRELYAKYQSACKGRRILKRLTRTKLDPYDQGLMLQARIDGLPKLFKDLADLKLKRRAEKMSDLDYTRRYATLVTRLGYNPAEALGTLDEALAQAKCEQSWNDWLFVTPCGGMEVDNPEQISLQVADWYARTELGGALARPKVTCKGDGRWCDVDYPSGIRIRVSFDKVPDSLIAVQVAPKPGPLRVYAYSCFQGQLSLH
jgi:hypothetical protein